MINQKALRMTIIDFIKGLGTVVIAFCGVALCMFVIVKTFSFTPELLFIFGLAMLVIPILVFFFLFMYDANKSHIESCVALENIKKMKVIDLPTDVTENEFESLQDSHLENTDVFEGILQELGEFVYVERRADVCSGAKVFKGTRVPLIQVVEQFRAGVPFAQIAEDYSQIEVDALHYALFRARMDQPPEKG